MIKKYLKLFIFLLPLFLLQDKALAEEPNDVIGKITPPPGIKQSLTEGGLVNFLNAIFRVIIIAGGVYSLINFMFAGFQFISAGGDSKQIEQAWGKIWQSLVGLLILAGSFVLAAIFGKIIFGDYGAIISPKILPPNQ